MRLKRIGGTKKPFYRLVVSDSRVSRDGPPIEVIGYYDPLKEPPVIKVNEERALFWLQKGAQPTDTVKSILQKSGVLAKFVKK